MYIKIGDLIINANRLVTAHIEDEGREVILTMAGGDEIHLRGDEARRFLESLPTYELVDGEE